NDRLDELFLPHRPPLAVYSYVRVPGGARLGAYYPMCEHSPEWQALQAAHAPDVPVRFIDLPWAGVAAPLTLPSPSGGEGNNAFPSPSGGEGRVRGEPANRYGDAEFRRSDYIGRLCRRLGVEDFDALWDTLFELDPGLSVETYLER